MARGEGDRDATTWTLLAAARAELLAVGQAEFAMEGVARRGFYSIGSVYTRWPDREALLGDLGAEVVSPDIGEALRAASSPAAAIEWTLGDGRNDVLLASEILLAGHTMPHVRPASLRVWEALRTGLGAYLPEGVAWYVATYAVGSALLHALGIDGPDPATGRVQWLVDACATGTDPRARTVSMPRFDTLEVPVVPGPERNDEVAIALIGAARILLEAHGAAGTSTRGIAASAGVTTGALYRRYEGKSRLLADVLLTQLEPDRYTWTWGLVRALASEDPFSDAATVLANRLLVAAEDAPAQKVLLQVGIAARSDPELRAQIAERIRIAHTARVDMVRHFAETGVLREDVSPEVFAWGFQTIPVGVRATLPIGVSLDPEAVSAAMAALLRAAEAV